MTLSQPQPARSLLDHRDLPENCIRMSGMRLGKIVVSTGVTSISLT
ncbi:MAG: hypothetical protein AAF703_22865 [Cyanobacteria bacterium P01_D01_bin.105]